MVSTDGPKEDVIFNCFDMIPIGEFNEGKSTTSAEIRKAAIHELINTNQFHYFVEVPVLYKGKDKKQITYWLNKITSEGGEGIMLNLSNGFYECKRSKQILKVKKFKTADVKVVDLYEGTGRNTGKLGGITVEFEFNGSTYQCNVGSGFTDQERINYWTNKGILLGQIVEIQYFEISSNLNGKHSMRFPIWIGRIRNEKSEISMN